MKTYISFIAVMISLIICSCGFNKGALTPMKIFSDNLNKWKPEGFDSKNGVLLIEMIESHKDKQQKRIEDYMAKNYPFKYEFFDGNKSVDSNGKYQNHEIYRFILASKFQIKTGSAESGITKRQMENLRGQSFPSQPVSIASYDFNFIDRLNNKTYPKTGISSSNAVITLKEIIKTILK